MEYFFTSTQVYEYSLTAKIPTMATLYLILFSLAAFFLIERAFRSKWKAPTTDFPKKWRTILEEKVAFYKALTPDEKELFEYKVQEFLTNVSVTGYDTTIDHVDKVLVGASAVIPIFAFPEWKYKQIDEVLIYPSKFNNGYQTKGDETNILGMVGTGVMDRKMILSRVALRQGFRNEKDKRNTAIHEFIHIIDKEDGVIDGIPSVLLEKQYTIPWIDMIEQKIEAIIANETDINPYASTSRIEFFAVLGEYFFERPISMKKKHPELYKMLCEIFDQDVAWREKKWRRAR